MNTESDGLCHENNTVNVFIHFHPLPHTCSEGHVGPFPDPNHEYRIWRTSGKYSYGLNKPTMERLRALCPLLMPCSWWWGGVGEA